MEIFGAAHATYGRSCKQPVLQCGCQRQLGMQYGAIADWPGKCCLHENDVLLDLQFLDHACDAVLQLTPLLGSRNEETHI